MLIKSVHLVTCDGPSGMVDIVMMFDVIGAVLLIGASVVMLLAYFDVLTKG